jgi:carbon storage regulator CsrA
MLVLSRSKTEKIVFPGLGITIEILGVSGNRVRVGVDAPRDIQVLRSEVVGENLCHDIGQKRRARVKAK